MPPRRSPLEKALHGPDKGEANDSQETVPSGQRGGVSAGGSTGRSGETLVDTTMPGHKPAHRRTVFKQDVDRTNTLSPGVNRAVQDAGGVPKPYDPAQLRDVAGNDVVQAYIDTLAQDVASAKWQLKLRDEDANISEEDITAHKRTLEDLHPEKSFRDILEQTTRNLLELGDAAWVKHYFSNGDGLAEAVPVDSARMFKSVDSHGLTEAYLQAKLSERSINEEFEPGEIVWFEWSSRTDHVYGHGPVEKGHNTIRLLNELSQKEEKDLREGMPPGIVSAAEDPDNPLPMDEFETVKEEFTMHEGERHRVLVSRGDWDYTDFSGNYQELQVLERNKFWIHVLGAVFKCNAPYAGFDFQEGNKAQNQSQKEAYAQRGFRQTLRQVEEALTRQLVHEDLSEDLIFEFEREQTVNERKEHAEYLEQAASAAQEWARNGKTVSITEDGMIDVEPGEVTPDDIPNEGGGGGGGILASVDKDGVQKGLSLTTPTGEDPVPEDAVESWRRFLADVESLGGMVENPESGNVHPGESIVPAGRVVMYGVDAEDANNLLAAYPSLNYSLEQAEERPQTETEQRLQLSVDEVEKADEVLLSAYESQIMPESVADIEKAAWGGDESVPDYVIEQIRMAIDKGAVFDGIKSIPEKARRELESLLEDKLTQPQGWSLDSLVGDAQDLFPGVDEDQLEVVMRTETASILNEAREEGYQSREESGRYKFKWVGPSDKRTTDACTELKEKTNPDHGGTPVSLPDLKRLEREVHAKHFGNLEYREHALHPNERHTFVRVVDA